MYRTGGCGWRDVYVNLLGLIYSQHTGEVTFVIQLAVPLTSTLTPDLLSRLQYKHYQRGNVGFIEVNLDESHVELETFQFYLYDFYQLVNLSTC